MLFYGVSHDKGLTLIELMIAIAIVGILSSIAYPNYTDFVLRSNRSEAQREVIRIANLQERFFIEQKIYQDDMTELGLIADPFVTESGLYQIDAVLKNNNTTFVLTAKAIGRQAKGDTQCLVFTINELGARTATSANCWQ